MTKHERLLRVDAVMKGPVKGGYRQVELDTDGGRVACRYYPVQGARAAAVFVGGAGGGWDSPARDLYPRLCGELRDEGVAGLRVRFRDPSDLQGSALDVLAGLIVLEEEGVTRAGLVGHSFGGAVVIQAARASNVVRTVVTLATQSYGTDPVAQLSPRCSVLLIHGGNDRVLPSFASEHVYRRAQEPKELQIFPGAGHGLNEASEQVHRLVRSWLVDRLRPERPPRA